MMPELLNYLVIDSNSADERNDVLEGERDAVSVVDDAEGASLVRFG